MRAELYRPDDPATTVAVATWADGRSRIEPGEGSIEGLDGLLRPVPVVVEDPSFRHPGTHGSSLLEPGSAEWFRAALLSRSETLGLAVRFVVETVVGGWDPAREYGSFRDRADRLPSS
jgi:hypothetical protein